ncbi:MAG: hypothetical protein HEQ23_12425 [Tepidisphaera sp.]
MVSLGRMWVCGAAMAAATMSACGQTLYLFGDRAGVAAMNSDGSAGAGFDRGEPAAWTPQSGFTSYVATRDRYTLRSGTAVAENGTTIAGYALGPYNERERYYPERAFISTAPGQFTFLNPLFGAENSTATGISGDGRVVCGNYGVRGYIFGGAFVWTAETGVESLGTTRPGHLLTKAYGMSRDGNAIVGVSVGIDSTDAFIWTRSGGIRALQDLPGNPLRAGAALAANHDASLIVGHTENNRAMIWRDGVPELLYGEYSHATSISDDGSVILGFASDENFIDYAAVFDGRGGVEPLVDYLRRLGVPFESAWRIDGAVRVSGDGRTFTGYVSGIGRPGTTFLVTIPAPSSVAVMGVTVAILRSRR